MTSLFLFIHILGIIRTVQDENSFNSYFLLSRTETGSNSLIGRTDTMRSRLLSNHKAACCANEPIPKLLVFHTRPVYGAPMDPKHGNRQRMTSNMARDSRHSANQRRVLVHVTPGIQAIISHAADNGLPPTNHRR